MSLPTKRVLSVAAAVASALLLFGAGEPAGLGPLAWVALVPLLVAAMAERRLVFSWLYGLVFGLTFFGIHLSWIFLFGWIAWAPLAGALALYVSAGPVLARVLRRFPLAPALIAGAWAGLELARDRWPVGGYSWGSVGTTQGAVPGVRALAPIVGVYGIGFLVVFVAALVADRVLSGGWSWGSLGIVAAALVAFVAADAVFYGSPPPGRAVRVLVVQGGVPRPPRPDQSAYIVRSHIDQTLDVFSHKRPDVVVWPESSIGVGAPDSATTDVAGLANALETPFLVGRETYERGALLNTVEHYSERGTRTKRYVKRHLVPFGEYVPFPFLRNVVSTLERERPVDIRPGQEATVFDVAGTKIATPICFESVFPRDFLDFTRKGVGLMVLSTNNSSFERSYASQQHLAHTRMRALETRQWVVQAALAGISATLRPDGRIENATALFEAASFVAEVRVRPAHSLYARTGDAFPSLFALAVLGALLVFGYTLATGRARRDPDDT